MKVYVNKEYDGFWSVFNKEGHVAYIQKCDNMFFGNHTPSYRVTVGNGRFLDSVKNFQSAKKVAYNYVRGNN